MAKTKSRVVEYTAHRDSKTGRFVSKQTYKRSKAHGGKRYHKVKIQYVRKRTVARGKRLGEEIPAIDMGVMAGGPARTIEEEEEIAEADFDEEIEIDPDEEGEYPEI